VKLYKLKDEVLLRLMKIHTHEMMESLKGLVLDKDEWNHRGYQFGSLEQAPQRVELEFEGTPRCDNYYLVKRGINISFTDQERELCEMALNGELTELNVRCFIEWYNQMTGYLVGESLLEEWLKERKNLLPN
jgi:hypothetical protein